MSDTHQAIFGGGCFWCTEAVFSMLKGVTSVEPGYAGGSLTNPSYERVSGGDTGHAEVIRITYDPSTISYQDLLTVFFGSHDPTTLNKQGADIGEQYRSVIFYSNDEEKALAEKTIDEINMTLKDGSHVVTQVVALQTFWRAEDYHKDYFKKNPTAPYCELIIEPKVEKVRERFAQLVRQDH